MDIRKGTRCSAVPPCEWRRSPARAARSCSAARAPSAMPRAAMTVISPSNERQLLAKPNPFGIGYAGERIAASLRGKPTDGRERAHLA